MTVTPPPRRPWHRRKRAWAAVALWLAIAYPFGLGPACYADGRGWLPRWAATLYRPVDEWIEADLPLAGPLNAYALWGYAASD